MCSRERRFLRGSSVVAVEHASHQEDEQEEER